MRRVLYSIDTVRIHKVSSRARIIYESLQWLRKRQNRDGSWGKKDNTLDKIVTTSHVIMSFLAAGYPSKLKFIQKGINWLTEGEGSTHDYCFWRIGPLLNIEEYSGIIERDIELMRQYHEIRIKPDPAQIIELFFLNVLKVLNREKSSLGQRLTNFMADEWKEEACWYNKATTTSFALSVIGEENLQDRKEIIEKSKELIRKKANDEGNSANWEGKITSTSYVIISITESWLKSDKILYDLCDKAVNWIINQQKGQSFWPSEEPPYGGKITSNEYSTALAIRALISFESTQKLFFPIEIIWKENDQIKKRHKILSYLFFYLLLISLFYVVYINKEHLTTSIGWFPQVLNFTAVAAGLLYPIYIEFIKPKIKK